MVKFKVSVNPHGQIYLASEIRKELNSKTLEILGNTRAIIMFPENTPLEDVLQSLEVISFDIKHRIELEKKENSRSRKAEDT